MTPGGWSETRKADADQHPNACLGLSRAALWGGTGEWAAGCGDALDRSMKRHAASTGGTEFGHLRGTGGAAVVPPPGDASTIQSADSHPDGQPADQNLSGVWPTSTSPR